MALELDTRQRAMLQEMGVQVWLPESGVAVLERSPDMATAPARATAAAPVPEAVQPAAHRPQPAPAERMPTPVSARPQSGRPAAVPVGAPPAGLDGVALDWQTLTEAVRNCQACALCAGRSHTTLVPLADNAAHCDWLVLGDPPDEDEDRAGAPFDGQDGVLLANMLRALGLRRANLPPSSAASSAAASPAQRAYVSNVLKCRPTHGAMPQAAELAACSAWLQREIALVRPKVILSMGRFANQLLLCETPALAALPLGKLRGTVHRYQGVAVVVSYPPKLLMRNSADKAKAWADLCLAAATLDAGR
jgi:DNA polymerase